MSATPLRPKPHLGNDHIRDDRQPPRQDQATRRSQALCLGRGPCSQCPREATWWADDSPRTRGLGLQGDRRRFGRGAVSILTKLPPHRPRGRSLRSHAWPAPFQACRHKDSGSGGGGTPDPGCPTRRRRPGRSRRGTRSPGQGRSAMVCPTSLWPSAAARAGRPHLASRRIRPRQLRPLAPRTADSWRRDGHRGPIARSAILGAGGAWRTWLLFDETIGGRHAVSL
jgi:hypothetical protein